MIPNILFFAVQNAISELISSVSTTWRQFRFENGSVYDEVTDSEMTLFGNAVMKDEMLRVPTADVANYAEFNPVTFDDNEDFYIRVTVKPDEPLSTHVNMPILGVYETTADVQTAWCIFQGGPAHPSRVGCIFFQYKTNDGRLVTLADKEVIPFTNTTTVEVARVNDVMYLFVNGTLRVQAVESKGNYKASTIPLRTFKIASSWATSIMAGEIHDIRIAKSGVDYPSADHTIESIPSYVRPEYATNDADDMILQLGFRRGSKLCEINDTPVTLNGTASITNDARLNLTNVTTSFARIPIPYFGASDFTIEFMCNISAVNASWGAGIGHFQAVGTASDNNRWMVNISNTRRLSFILARSANANDTVGMLDTVDGGFEFNVDNHVVVQRVNGVTTLYLNGNVVGRSETQNFPIRGGAGTVTTQHLNGATSLGGSIWNFRIADKALYRIGDTQ